MHGTYQRVGDQIRVVARLVDVSSATIQTQEGSTDRLTNLLQLQDELASTFAVSLEASGLPATHRPETVSLEAYRAVTEARALYASGKWDRALEKLERAVDLDPQYAQAYALLSKTSSRLAAPAVFAGGPIDECRQLALSGAQQALALNPTLYDDRRSLVGSDAHAS